MRLRTFNHSRPDLTPYGFTCELWKAAPMRRPDRHDEIELNLLMRGSLTYLLGGTRVTLPAGRLGAFWAALPHQIIGSEDCPRYFVITLPLAWFLQCGLPPRLTDRLLSGNLVADQSAKRLELDLALCRQWKQDLAGTRGNPTPACLLEIQARLMRMADSLPGNSGDPSGAIVAVGKGDATKAEQMAGYIARHYRDAPSIESISRSVQLHPNYAMNLFKPMFRCTLNEHLTHYRISQAQRLLATSEMKVLDVAMESGFRTSSRFYDAFQTACGCSPTRYRKEHQAN